MQVEILESRPPPKTVEEIFAVDEDKRQRPGHRRRLSQNVPPSITSISRVTTVTKALTFDL
jgi:hypothetical protein